MELKSNKLTKNDLWILTGLSVSLFCYQIITAAFSGYGYFIDELYYIACSKRLAFGYIDQPPLSIFLLAITRSLFGDSIIVIRLLPALAMAVTVFITGLITHQFGGTSKAIIISALAVMVMPVYLLFGSFYSMNPFEILIWAIILYLAVKMIGENNPKYLLGICLLMGIGLEMKHTLILYGIALFFGIVFTDTRKLLWNRWLLWGGIFCFLLLLPNIIWQYLNGFPSLEFYSNAMVYKNIATNPLDVLLNQIKFINPFILPLWIAGLIYLLFSADCKKYRFLGIAYLLLLTFMIISQSSRPDRISAMYIILFAAGGAAIGKLRMPVIKKYSAPLIIFLVILGGIIFIPVSTPLLPPPVLAKYLTYLGLSFDIEAGKTDEALPQWLADRLGWEELATEVSKVYKTLSPEEQINSVIISNSYGEAGALELFGGALGLPKVFATHNSYHSWGPPSDSVKTFIAVLVEKRDLESRFESVVEAGVQTCKYCSRPQRRIPIYIARNPNFSIESEWSDYKNYH